MIHRLPGELRSIVALALLALIWGYNWVVMKKSLQFMGPFDFNALRMLLGGAALLLFMVWRGLPVRPRAAGRGRRPSWSTPCPSGS